MEFPIDGFICDGVTWSFDSDSSLIWKSLASSFYRILSKFSALSCSSNVFIVFLVLTQLINLHLTIANLILSVLRRTIDNQSFRWPFVSLSNLLSSFSFIKVQKASPDSPKKLAKFSTNHFDFSSTHFPFFFRLQSLIASDLEQSKIR
jgi:hypothetical protein